MSETESCRCCRAPGATERLTVREPTGLLATWALCARCWSLLTLGFGAVQPGDRLDARTAPTAHYHLTPADIQRYIRAGAGLVRRQG